MTAWDYLIVLAMVIASVMTIALVVGFILVIVSLVRMIFYD